MKSTSPYLLLEEYMTPIYNKLMLTLLYTIRSCKNRKKAARSDYNMIYNCVLCVRTLYD